MPDAPLFFFLPHHPELPRTLLLIPHHYRTSNPDSIMRNLNRSINASPTDADTADMKNDGTSQINSSNSEAADSLSRSLEQSMSMSMSTSLSMGMLENEQQSMPATDDTNSAILSAGGEVDLLNSVVAEDKNLVYPEWDWDHVRTWVPIRRGDRYHPDQINALANQDVVMLEKFNGHEFYGSVEKGSLMAASRIKYINRKVKILFYLNAMVHYGGYAANDYFKDEWAMMDPITKKPYLWRDKFISYNHTNVDFRQWWVNRALEMVSSPHIDGIFIDGLCKVNRGDLPDQDNGAAYLETAKQLRESLPPGKLLIGNTLRAYGFPDGNVKNMMYLDGSYLENWMDPRFVKRSLQLMYDALQQGQIIMMNAGPHNLDTNVYYAIKNLSKRYEFLNEPKYIDYPLGCFLLVVQPHAYFSFHEGVDAKLGKLTVFDNNKFDAITRKLGKPLGKYVEESNGVFSREFEYVKVHVDINTQEGLLTVQNVVIGDEDNDDDVGDTLDDDDKVFDDDITDDVVDDDEADDHM